MSDKSKAMVGDKPAAASVPIKPTVLGTPDGAVVIRKVRGPDGIHPRIGQVFAGGLSTVQPKVAAELTAGESAEFEAMNAHEAAKITRYREAHQAKGGSARQ